MYEVCMSADRRVEPNFDQSPEPWTQEPPACLGPESLVYEEETSNGIAGLLLKSGFVVLFSIAVYGGYQFIKTDSSSNQLASSQSNYDWSSAPNNTADGDDIAGLNGQVKKVRKIDLTKTGSIKKSTTPLGKPVPIQPKITPETEFHVVKSGDTLSAIGRKFKISSADIMKINGIEDARRIKPGMKLIVTK